MRAEAQNLYRFSVYLQGVSWLDDDMEDQLYEAGCDDATISLRFGITHMTFARHAKSWVAAFASAEADILKAGIGVTGVKLDRIF